MRRKTKGLLASIRRQLWAAICAEHRQILGETIRKYRKQTGLTQEKLAEKADVHPVYVGEVERGEQAASVQALLRIGLDLGFANPLLLPPNQSLRESVELVRASSARGKTIAARTTT